MHAAADAADALGHDRDVVVAQNGLGQFLDAAMDHEAAVFAAAHPLPFDVEPEMGRLVEGGMKRAEGHDRATLRRFVELEFALVIVVIGDEIPRNVLAQRVDPIGPAVRQDQAFRIRVAGQFDSDQIAQFALGPVGRRHDRRDALHTGLAGGNFGQDAAKQVVAIKREIVRHQERAGKRPVIRANARDETGIQVAKNVFADGLQRGRFDEDKQAMIRGDIRPPDGGA